MEQIKLIKSNIRFLVVILFSAIPRLLTAQEDNKPLTQTIRGIVTEATTGSPVGYANIAITNLPTTGTSTASLGQFRLTNVPIYRTVRYSGHIFGLQT